MGTANVSPAGARHTARETGDSEIVALALENLAKDISTRTNPNYAQHLLKEA